MRRPDFDIAFSIGGFHIYWYAILLALGIAVALLITDKRSRGRALPKDFALDLCILGVPFGVLGARLFACISGAVAWNHFFDLTHPGLSFFGGLIFSALAMLIYIRLRKASLSEVLDAAAPGMYAGIGIAVWGDFFNRSHFGPLVERSAFKWFPLATIGSDLEVHYAAFFYEFLLCVLMIILYYALLQRRFSFKAGRFFVLLLVYCFGRFCVDSIRVDKVMLGSLGFDQWCEIGLAVLCVIILIKGAKPSQTLPHSKGPDKPSEAVETSTKAEDKEPSTEEEPEPPVQQAPFSGLE